MSKGFTEDHLKLDINRLNQLDLFSSALRFETLTWPENNGFTSMLDIVSEIDSASGNAHIKLSYNYVNLHGNSISCSPRIELDSVRCQFGGKRYWFICPGLYGTDSCGERVGMLYLDDGMFACRTCHNLTYKSCNKSRFERTNVFFKYFDGLTQLEDLEERVKRTHYKGRPTKLYKRMLELEKKIARISPFA